MEVTIATVGVDTAALKTLAEKHSKIKRYIAEKPYFHPVRIDPDELLEVLGEIDFLHSALARAERERDDWKEKARYAEARLDDYEDGKTQARLARAERVEEAANNRMHLVVRLARNYVWPSLRDVERAVESIQRDPNYRAEIFRDALTQLQDCRHSVDAAVLSEEPATHLEEKADG